MEKNRMLPSPHKILSIYKHTETEHTLRVECDVEPECGQFFMLSLPRVGEAPISASGRGEGYVEFTIRNVGNLTQAIFGLEPGDTLFLRGPYGNAFPVNQYENKDLVIICGGTGMAPVMTMINHFYDHPEVCKSVHIIAGFKNLEEVLFQDEINKFKERFHVITTLSREEADGFEKGRVTDFFDQIPIAEFEDYNIVVVGPSALMQSAAEKFIEQGATEDKIWVSFERKMSCGVGKCGHCKVNGTYICLEGPVFNYSKAKNMMD